MRQLKEKMPDKIYYFDRTIRLVKDIVADTELTSEDKVRILGVIL